MEDFDDALDEFNRIYQSLSDRLQTYETNPLAASSGNTLATAKSDLRRLKDALSGVKEAHRGLSPVEASKVRSKVAETDKKYTTAETRLNSAQATSATTTSASKPTQAQLVAKKAIEANMRLEDTNRVAKETVETAGAVADRLGEQTEQMRGISKKAQDVEAHARKGKALTKQMLKLERLVNGILWGLSALFLILSAVAFWVFHHNVSKDPEPVEPVEPVEPIEPDPVSRGMLAIMGAVRGRAAATTEMAEMTEMAAPVSRRRRAF